MPRLFVVFTTTLITAAIALILVFMWDISGYMYALGATYVAVLFGIGVFSVTSYVYERQIEKLKNELKEAKIQGAELLEKAFTDEVVPS